MPGRGRRAQSPIASKVEARKGKTRHHSHREDRGRDVTSLIAKAVRRGRRTITRETRVLPDPSASMRLRSTKAVFEQVLGSRAIYLRGRLNSLAWPSRASAIPSIDVGMHLTQPNTTSSGSLWPTARITREHWPNWKVGFVRKTPAWSIWLACVGPTAFVAPSVQVGGLGRWRVVSGFVRNAVGDLLFRHIEPQGQT